MLSALRRRLLARTRTARWSAERLTAASVEAGWTIGRAEDFHAEPRLYGEPHPELTDYRHSGFDRGHLTPSADMPDASSRDETFSLANIVPQEADNNRHIWSDIEQTVRRLSRRNGSIYVVTGPIFAPETSHIGAGVAYRGRSCGSKRIVQSDLDPRDGRCRLCLGE